MFEAHRFSIKNKTSGYVSTTKLLAAAQGFADGYGSGYIYTIKKPRIGRDINAILGNLSPFPFEHEFAVPKRFLIKK